MFGVGSRDASASKSAKKSLHYEEKFLGKPQLKKVFYEHFSKHGDPLGVL